MSAQIVNLAEVREARAFSSRVALLLGLAVLALLVLAGDQGAQ